MAVVACGGEVMIEGEDGLEEVSGNSGSASGGSGKGDTDCVSCSEGDCGLCELEAGQVLYKCPGSMPPDIGVLCQQTGSVFHAPDGSSYVCWRCD